MLVVFDFSLNDVIQNTAAIVAAVFTCLMYFKK